MIELDKDKQAQSELTMAIKTTIATLLEKPLTVGRLRKISEVAGKSVKLLQTLSTGVDELKTHVPPAPVPAVFSPFGQVQPNPNLDEGEDEEPVGMPLVTAPAAETFGSAMIREIVSLLPGLLKNQTAREPKPSVFELVNAIAEAERLGMPKLAAKLREKLDVDAPEESETSKEFVGVAEDAALVPSSKEDQ